MAYDLTRCPQTMDECRDYFFTIISRTPGTPANNWQYSLTNSNIPHNVYTPGMKADASWPLFGMTQQWSNGPKARVFFPSNQADENGFYTTAWQYLDDGPDGTLVWAWYYIAGHDYAPVQGASGGGEPPIIIVPGTGVTEARVQEMINASLQPLYASIDAAVKLGDKVALRTNSGLLAGLKGGGPTTEDAPIDWIGKGGDAHAWESLTIEKGE